MNGISNEERKKNEFQTEWYMINDKKKATHERANKKTHTKNVYNGIKSK